MSNVELSNKELEQKIKLLIQVNLGIRDSLEQLLADNAEQYKTLERLLEDTQNRMRNDLTVLSSADYEEDEEDEDDYEDDWDEYKEYYDEEYDWSDEDDDEDDEDEDDEDWDTGEESAWATDEEALKAEESRDGVKPFLPYMVRSPEGEVIGGVAMDCNVYVERERIRRLQEKQEKQEKPLQAEPVVTKACPNCCSCNNHVLAKALQATEELTHNESIHNESINKADKDNKLIN